MTNLQKKRTELGLSQSQLAEKAEVSIRTLQCYERGARDINKAYALIVYKLAKALGCKVEDLLELKEEIQCL